jgi:hypothetical protein
MYSQLLLAIQQSFIMFCHQPIMNHNVLDVCYCYGDKDDAAYTFFFICMLYIKQASSKVSIVGEDDSEPAWVEYKIKETNMFTMDKYHQVH